MCPAGSSHWWSYCDCATCPDAESDQASTPWLEWTGLGFNRSKDVFVLKSFCFLIHDCFSPSPWIQEIFVSHPGPTKSAWLRLAWNLHACGSRAAQGRCQGPFAARRGLVRSIRNEARSREGSWKAKGRGGAAGRILNLYEFMLSEFIGTSIRKTPDLNKFQ